MPASNLNIFTRQSKFDRALVGIELMHMIKKRQMVVEEGDEGLTAAELFYSLAA
jgi:hypothetical protein